MLEILFKRLNSIFPIEISDDFNMVLEQMFQIRTLWLTD